MIYPGTYSHKKSRADRAQLYNLVKEAVMKNPQISKTGIRKIIHAQEGILSAAYMKARREILVCQQQTRELTHDPAVKKLAEDFGMKLREPRR